MKPLHKMTPDDWRKADRRLDQQLFGLAVLAVVVVVLAVFILATPQTR